MDQCRRRLLLRHHQAAQPRDVFTSVANLQDAIRSYIRNHNRNPKPFVWTKPADIILAQVSRVPVASD
jgi:hypothetical protein